MCERPGSPTLPANDLGRARRGANTLPSLPFGLRGTREGGAGSHRYVAHHGRLGRRGGPVRPLRSRAAALLCRQGGAFLAEDVVAETFLIAYERRDRLLAGPVRAWLYGIATNLLRRHRRTEVRALRALARTGWDPHTADVAERAVDRADASVLSRDLAAVLARLPARQRDVLLLHAVAELDHDQIAATLDIPLGTVRSALHRARTKVRAAIRTGTTTEGRL
jgi:RNA polymerase sigma factor (sigma-70 family)